MIVPQRFTASASACPSACLSVPLFLSLCRLHAHTHTCASTCLLAVFVVSCAVELHLNARSRRLEQLLSATASLASFLQVGTFPPFFGVLRTRACACVCLVTFIQTASV